MSVKRYELTDNGVEVFSDGRYVLHSDYAALLARHNALVEAVKRLRKIEGNKPLHPVQDGLLVDARAEVDRLLQEPPC